MPRGNLCSDPKRALMDHRRKKLARRQKRHLLSIKTPAQLREMVLATRRRQA